MAATLLIFNTAALVENALSWLRLFPTTFRIHIYKIVKLGLTVCIARILEYSQGSYKWQPVSCIQVFVYRLTNGLKERLLCNDNVTGIYLIFSLWKT